VVRAAPFLDHQHKETLVQSIRQLKEDEPFVESMEECGVDPKEFLNEYYERYRPMKVPGIVESEEINSFLVSLQLFKEIEKELKEV